ncbi:hypothetical protein [Lacticaseibacillus parakribbianus]|uniref:hypothetical protein n=1 Tax=Lacticaseibacillus parakribbianus TaxID=2970927 RepID=UPI0021CB3D1B|nr:hypothetical protein [Lacticaseibacillus parakribbianus]
MKKVNALIKALIGAGMLLGATQAAGPTTATPVSAATKPAYVTITKKNYSIWQDSSWQKRLHSSTNWYHHSFKASSQVTYNGTLYYRLSKDGKYFGMINAAATQTGTGAQGAAIATSKYVSLNKKGYTIWGDFGWQTKRNTTSSLYQNTYQVKATYFHSNGSTYYSLYRGTTWVGYLSSAAAATAKGAQGNAISTNRYVKLTKKGYTVWGDFGWQTKRHNTSNYYNKVYQVKALYKHANGTTYYSLYSGSSWFGYLSAGATTATSKPAAKPITKPTQPAIGSMVYVAASLKGTAYHLNPNCRGLSNATSGVIKISLKKALALHMKLCRYER